MKGVRALARRATVRVVGILPPALARQSSGLAGLLLRDAGWSRRSAQSMSRALEIVKEPSGAVHDAQQPLTLAEIARRVHRATDTISEWADRGLLGPPDVPGPPPRWTGGVERARLVGYLLRSGQSLDELAAAARDNRLPLLVVDQAIAGRGRYTLEDLAARSEITPEFAERVLRALGVPRGDPEDELFGRRDVRAMRIISAMRALWSDDEILDIVAVIGRSMAQIAACEVEAFRSGVEQQFLQAGMGELEMALRTAALVDLLVPPANVLLGVAHRRMLEAANGLETVARLEEEEGALPGQQEVTVGFADIVGYTAASESLSPLQLGEMSSRLLRIAETVFSAHGVRVVKSIGDSVMFIARDPVTGAKAALELLEEAGDGLPPLHVGMASGPALRRHADYFGRTVNIAARLAEATAAGTVLLCGAGSGEGWDEAGLARGRPRTMRLKGLKEPVEVVRVSRQEPSSSKA